MPRSIWNGAISFGLVNVPVGLYSAVEPKDIQFHQMTKSGHRIRMKRVDDKTGREVEYSELLKGYELSKGKYVAIDREELAAAAPKQTRTIEIEDFVDLTEIDPIYYESTYYLAPRGSGADKSYALLREAMERSERAGIGRFVLRTKQYLAAIRAADDVLLLNTMYFADEIRDTKGLDVPKRVMVGARELKIADQLIESLTVDWDPERYDDTYRAEVMKVIRRKAKGQPIAVEAEEEPRAKVVDLVEALQASLDAKRKPRKRTAKKAAKRKAS
jgi:DNA end-binding protein Ku